MSLVSIIVPVHNSEKYIDGCVGSILNQSFSDFEVLLIENNSTDNSLNLCYEYAKKDKRVSVYSQTKKGVSAARNLGIEKAVGKYILFVDSDDYIKENYIEALVNAKNEYPDCPNIWCDFLSVESYDNIDYTPIKRNEDNPLYTIKSRKNYMTLSEKWLTQNLWNKLYERDIIVNNNLRMKEWMSLGEDIIFILEYLDAAGSDKIIMVNESLYMYINAPKPSLTHSFHKNEVEMSREINKLLVYFAEKWQLSPDEQVKMYNSAFYRLDNAMKSIIKHDTSLSFVQRLKKCNSILKSEDFKFYFYNSNCNINFLQRFAYRSKVYFFVYIFDKLYDLKTKINKR